MILTLSWIYRSGHVHELHISDSTLGGGAGGDEEEGEGRRGGNTGYNRLTATLLALICFNLLYSALVWFCCWVWGQYGKLCTDLLDLSKAMKTKTVIAFTGIDRSLLDYLFFVAWKFACGSGVLGRGKDGRNGTAFG